MKLSAFYAPRRAADLDYCTTSQYSAKVERFGWRRALYCCVASSISHLHGRSWSLEKLLVLLKKCNSWALQSQCELMGLRNNRFITLLLVCSIDENKVKTFFSWVPGNFPFFLALLFKYKCGFVEKHVSLTRIFLLSVGYNLPALHNKVNFLINMSVMQFFSCVKNCPKILSMHYKQYNAVDGQNEQIFKNVFFVCYINKCWEQGAISLLINNCLGAQVQLDEAWVFSSNQQTVFLSQWHALTVLKILMSMKWRTKNRTSKSKEEIYNATIKVQMSFWILVVLKVFGSGPSSLTRTFPCNKNFATAFNKNCTKMITNETTEKNLSNIAAAFIFTPVFLGKVALAAALGLEMPHGFQKTLILLLAPHQDRIKQSRGCNHATYFLINLMDAFLWTWPTGIALTFDWSILVTCPNHRGWDLYSEKWLNIQGFTNFTPAHFVAVSHRELFAKLPVSHCEFFTKTLCILDSTISVFWIALFPSLPRFVTSGEDRNKHRFKKWVEAPEMAQ